MGRSWVVSGQGLRAGLVSLSVIGGLPGCGVEREASGSTAALKGAAFDESTRRGWGGGDGR